MSEQDFSTESTPAFDPAVTGENPVFSVSSFDSAEFSTVPPVAEEEPKRLPRRTNFALLAWAFIVFSIGIGIWLIPFRASFDPFVVAVAASGTIGSLLLVTAILVAVSERKHRR